MAKPSDIFSDRGIKAWGDRYTAQAKAYKKSSNPQVRANANPTPKYNPLGSQYAYYQPPKPKTTTFLPMVMVPPTAGLTDEQKQMIYNKYFNGRGLTPNGPLTPGVAQPTGVEVDTSMGYGGPRAAYGSDYSYNYNSGYGSNEVEEVPVTWSTFDGGISNAPPWWKAMMPSAMNDATEYLASLNMLIPFLSPEDQRTVASNLYAQDATNFGHLNPESTKLLLPMGDGLSTGTKRMFTDAVHARNALAALTKLAGAVGKSDADLGTGYRYLRSILNLGDQYGGDSAKGNAQTRRQYIEMMSALDPLIAQSKTQQLAPYESLVKMLTTPFFSKGQLTPIYKDANGQVSFGGANKAWL